MLFYMNTASSPIGDSSILIFAIITYILNRSCCKKNCLFYLKLSALLYLIHILIQLYYLTLFHFDDTGQKIRTLMGLPSGDRVKVNELKNVYGVEMMTGRVGGADPAAGPTKGHGFWRGEIADVDDGDNCGDTACVMKADKHDGERYNNSHSNDTKESKDDDDNNQTTFATESDSIINMHMVILDVPDGGVYYRYPSLSITSHLNLAVPEVKDLISEDLTDAFNEGEGYANRPPQPIPSNGHLPDADNVSIAHTISTITTFESRKPAYTIASPPITLSNIGQITKKFIAEYQMGKLTRCAIFICYFNFILHV